MRVYFACVWVGWYGQMGVGEWVWVNGYGWVGVGEWVGVPLCLTTSCLLIFFFHFFLTRLGSPVGLLLTCIQVLVYYLAILFEGPFTAQIYAEKEQKEKD